MLGKLVGKGVWIINLTALGRAGRVGEKTWKQGQVHRSICCLKDLKPVVQKFLGSKCKRQGFRTSEV